jgi:hypothetical protein
MPGKSAAGDCQSAGGRVGMGNVLTTQVRPDWLRSGVGGHPGPMTGDTATEAMPGYVLGRILGTQTVHLVQGTAITGALQRTACGLTRQLLPAPAGQVSCRHCLRLIDA